MHAFSLYPLLISPFGDYSANVAHVTMQVTTPQGVTVATTGRQVSAGGGTLRWDSEVAVPWVAVAGGRRHRRVEVAVLALDRVDLYPRIPHGPVDKLATYTGQAVEYYSRLLWRHIRMCRARWG